MILRPRVGEGFDKTPAGSRDLLDVRLVLAVFFVCSDFPGFAVDRVKSLANSLNPNIAIIAEFSLDLINAFTLSRLARSP